jgi:hypothetical protein
MAMTSRSNRTFICSVLFLDIVAYSKKSVIEQIWLKDRFNTLLSAALSRVEPGDRIILDTGDGAAISFLGDPDAALFSALSLRDALDAPPPEDGPPIGLRIGINLGPVKLVKDLNGQPNIVGDGINVAQRVMSFSEPGQILVSRSYYEVVSRLSEAYAKLFRFEGLRTDKHVREHEVYTVGAAEGLLPAYRAESAKVQSAGSPAMDQLALITTRVDNLRRKPWLGTTLAVVAILAAAIMVRGQREIPQNVAPAENGATARNSIQAEPAKPAANLAPVKSVAPRNEKKPAPAVVPEKSPRMETADNAEAIASVTISFAISPWGEIHVDGKKQGVSPPLRSVRVKPGQHIIEIRNTTFPPYVETVEVAAQSPIKIKHKFGSGAIK